eukprot:GHVN01031220.1.p1 GENE.GHVN01031220.1~~GHVN01031220.1.p1  ORF type:complete len:363 (-),score=56.19 GHVN01031220.1:57-1145(-)
MREPPTPVPEKRGSQQPATVGTDEISPKSVKNGDMKPAQAKISHIPKIPSLKFRQQISNTLTAPCDLTFGLDKSNKGSEPLIEHNQYTSTSTTSTQTQLNDVLTDEACTVHRNERCEKGVSRAAEPHTVDAATESDNSHIMFHVGVSSDPPLVSEIATQYSKNVRCDVAVATDPYQSPSTKDMATECETQFIAVSERGTEYDATQFRREVEVSCDLYRPPLMSDAATEWDRAHFVRDVETSIYSSKVTIEMGTQCNESYPTSCAGVLAQFDCPLSASAGVADGNFGEEKRVHQIEARTLKLQKWLKCAINSSLAVERAKRSNGASVKKKVDRSTTRYGYTFLEVSMCAILGVTTFSLVIMLG